MYSNIYFNFIQFQLYTGTSLARKKKLTLAWIEILTCKKSIEWNADKFIIYLIGIITKCAFYYDPESFFGIGEVVENLYKVSSGKFKKFKEKKNIQLILGSIFGMERINERSLFLVFFTFTSAYYCIRLASCFTLGFIFVFKS